jgi:uncharacterized protein
MASTEVDVRDNRELRRVEALLAPDGEEDGSAEVAGFAEYRIGVDGTFEFTHTEVDDRFEGQGVGGRLAAGVMDLVRTEGVKIQPTCSFIRSYMQRHEETHDLLADGASLGSEEESDR